MEMHQVRYFLAVARTLNFTRAAEECHVAQPSSPAPSASSKAARRRSVPPRAAAIAADRARPAHAALLKQCYDSAMSARSLASAIKSGEVGSLRLALSQTIDPSLVMPHGRARKIVQRTRTETLPRQQHRSACLSQARRCRAWSRCRSRRGMERLDPGRCSPRISRSWSTPCTVLPMQARSRSTISNPSASSCAPIANARRWCSSSCARTTSTSSAAMRRAPSPTYGPA